MSKQEFLEKLRAKLSGLPEEDIAERLTFYSEMIDDRIEEGLSEEEAVEGIGSVNEIASQIIADIPHIETPAEEAKPQRTRNRKAILLVLSAIVWVPLLIAVLAIAVALYVALWSVVVSLWAAFGALCAGVLGGSAAGIKFMIDGNILQGIAMLGAAFVCVGLTIFAFFGCRALTKGVLFVTKKIIQCIRNFFAKKEEL